MALVCNCKRVVSRGDGTGAEFRVVKSRKWDCPSCGLDRKRTLAKMCSVAAVGRMLTLTIEQPRAHFVGADPGELPPGARLTVVDGHLVPMGWGVAGLASVPDRHRRCTGRKGDAGCLARKRAGKPGTCTGCDPATHLAWNVRNGGVRWRVLPDCPHCARWVSKAVRRFVRKVRVEFPEFDYLQVREVHKSGGVHVHMAAVGLSRVVTRRSQAGKDLKRMWSEVGGGFLDVGKHGEHPAEAAGWYIGKYLAKVQDDVFARGFRRWSRAARFASSVRMSWQRQDPVGPLCDERCEHPSCESVRNPGGWADPYAPLRLGGWVHPDGTEAGRRWWHYSEPADYQGQAPALPGRGQTWRCPTARALARPVALLPDGLLWARWADGPAVGGPVTQPATASAASRLDSRTAKCTQPPTHLLVGAWMAGSGGPSEALEQQPPAAPSFDQLAAF